jgi:hypothetical protein
MHERREESKIGVNGYRVNSNENITEREQFTQMKMLLKPTASFLVVDFPREGGSGAARRPRAPLPHATLLGWVAAACHNAASWQ